VGGTGPQGGGKDDLDRFRHGGRYVPVGTPGVKPRTAHRRRNAFSISSRVRRNRAGLP
jgi:hypothetical protein